MEAASFIAGLPGLIIACADLYKLTVNHRHRARDVSVVINKVAIEQWKFAYWLQDVGFVEGSKPMLRLPPAVQMMMLQLLKTIEATLTEVIKLVEKYEGTAPNPPASSNADNLNPPEHFFRLRIKDSAKSRLPKPMKKVVDGAINPMTWAAGGFERVEKLVDDLKSHNEGLNFISEKLNNAKSTLLPARLLPYISDQHNLQTVIEATTQHDPELARCAEIKKEVLSALNKAPVAQRTGSGITMSTLKLMAPSIKKRTKLPDSRLTRAEYNNRKIGTTETVLLEDRSYQDGIDSKYELFVDLRVQEIATILAKVPKPQRMKVLECAGYVQNRAEKSFSFVFRFPNQAMPDIDPVSLQKILPPSQSSWGERQSKVTKITSFEKPALSVRFSMAESLSQSIALLLACGVLHKGITPANIVFFCMNNTYDKICTTNHSLTSPFVTGFSWARLHGAKYRSDTAPNADFASSSSLLHAHPAYSYTTEQRYLKIFDVYSLGLIFLQIGLWKPLSDIADQIFPSPKSSLNQAGETLDGLVQDAVNFQWLRQKIADWRAEIQLQKQIVAQSDGIAALEDPRRSFQHALVRNIERLLGAEMGEIYTQVVARCLTGDLNCTGIPKHVIEVSSDEADPDHVLLDAFSKGVIEQLEKCNA